MVQSKISTNYVSTSKDVVGKSVDESGRLPSCSVDGPERIWWVTDWVMSLAVKFFSKLINYFFGYFDPINIFLDNRNKRFSG